MIGIVQHVNQENKLFSVALEDGTYSVCLCRDSFSLENGNILFGGFQFFGMNYLETESTSKHILVDVLNVYLHEKSAEAIVNTSKTLQS